MIETPYTRIKADDARQTLIDVLSCAGRHSTLEDLQLLCYLRLQGTRQYMTLAQIRYHLHKLDSDGLLFIDRFARGWFKQYRYALKLVCEGCERTNENPDADYDISVYKYLCEEDGTVTLCSDCAPKHGFCTMCSYFVAGSGYDHKLESRHVCTECWEELRYECGELDDEGDGDFNY